MHSDDEPLLVVVDSTPNTQEKSPSSLLSKSPNWLHSSRWQGGPSQRPGLHDDVACVRVYKYTPAPISSCCAASSSSSLVVIDFTRASTPPPLRCKNARRRFFLFFSDQTDSSPVRSTPHTFSPHFNFFPNRRRKIVIITMSSNNSSILSVWVIIPSRWGTRQEVKYIEGGRE